MHIPGHLAVALLQHRLPPLSSRPAALYPLLVASLFPDIIDKSLGYGLQVMPNGRHYAHNLFSLVGLSLLVSLVWGKQAGWAWFWGHLGHLVVDGQGWVPWFFPARKYVFKQGRFSLAPAQFLRELAYLAIALLIYRLSS